MTLKISKDLSLPDEAALWTIADLGIKGSGKTWGADVLAEEMIKNNIPITIIDGMGTHWGLRSSADGKGPGLPVVVFGGEHADLGIPMVQNPRAKLHLMLDVEKLKLMVKAICESRINAVLDTSQLSKNLQRQVVAVFVEELLHINSQYGIRHVFLEEVDMYCLSADTELLTRTGWKSYRQITLQEEALTLNLSTNLLEYQKIERLIIRKHDGPIDHLRTKTGLDSLTTEDHRSLIQPFDHGKYQKYFWKPLEYRTLSKSPRSFRILAAGEYCRKIRSGLSEELCELIGWIITDGNWHTPKKKAICLTQSKKWGKERIRYLLPSLGINFTESSRYREPSGSTINGRVIKSRLPETRFYISVVDTSRIKEIMGEELHRIPRTLLDTDQSSMKALYKGLIGGDGSIAIYETRISKQERSRTSYLSSLKPGLSDDFQELCVKTGVRSKISGNRIVVSERYPFHFIQNKKTKLSQEIYKGIVWDITVPNGNFIARRNGAVFITGNCPQRIVGDVAVCAGAIDSLVRRGGNFNIGCTLISQRHAVVNKDILTQASCLLIFRTIHNLDKKAVMEWVKNIQNPNSGTISKWFDGLRGLDDGEAWIWYPKKDNELFQKIKIRRRYTLHATREFFRQPEALKNLKMMDVSVFVEKFQKVFSPKPVIVPQDTPIPPSRVPIQSSITRSTTDPWLGWGRLTIPDTRPPIPPEQRDTLEDRAFRGHLPEDGIIHQDLPNYVIQREHSTFIIQEPEPKSLLGRLLIVLKQGTDAGGNKIWGLSSIEQALSTHGWLHSIDEIKGIVTYLLQTEHLTAIQRGPRQDYKFTGSSRVQVTDTTQEVVVQ